MMIYVASDHAGFALKKHIIAFLADKGYDFTDMGTDSEESCDYADYGRKTALEVVANGGLGILICGTGAGMSYAANRIPGARCVCCSEPATARLARSHNDANLLAVGARIIGEELCEDIVSAFLKTHFSGGERHIRRIKGIEPR